MCILWVSWPYDPWMHPIQSLIRCSDESADGGLAHPSACAAGPSDCSMAALWLR